jgi:hypothetical protein
MESQLNSQFFRIRSPSLFRSFGWSPVLRRVAPTPDSLCEDSKIGQPTRSGHQKHVSWQEVEIPVPWDYSNLTTLVILSLKWLNMSSQLAGLDLSFCGWHKHFGDLWMGPGHSPWIPTFRIMRSLGDIPWYPAVPVSKELMLQCIWEICQPNSTAILLFGEVPHQAVVGYDCQAMNKDP